MPNKWLAYLLVLIIIGSDLAMVWAGTLGLLHIGWSLGGVGIVTLLGTLMVFHHLSGSSKLENGEVRKALTVASLAVYFPLLGLLTFTGFTPADTELARTVVGSFTTLVGVVFAFYFGTRTAEEIQKMRDPDKYNEYLKAKREG